MLIILLLNYISNKIMSDNKLLGQDESTCCCCCCSGETIPISKIIELLSSGDSNIESDKVISINPFKFVLLHTKFRVSLNDVVCSFENGYTAKIMNKSNHTLYFTNDYKYIIKTLSSDEADILTNLCDSFVDYVFYNKSFLAKIIGFYRIKNICCDKYCILMLNSANGEKPEIIYDLKGREKKLKSEQSSTINDNTFNSKFTIYNKEIVSILLNDCNFLKSNQLMDYSLLILEYKTNQKHTLIDAIKETHSNIRPLNSSSRPLDSSSRPLDSSRRPLDSSLRSLDSSLRSLEEECYISFTIIDFLNKYTGKKKVARFFKRFKYKETQLSSINSDLYYQRMYNFIVDKIV